MDEGPGDSSLNRRGTPSPSTNDRECTLAEHWNEGNISSLTSEEEVRPPPCEPGDDVTAPRPQLVELTSPRGLLDTEHADFDQGYDFLVLTSPQH